jgi:hypothetical protein
MPQVPAGCPHKCCAWSARKRGYRLNPARASASNPRLTRDASQLIVPSRIALVRRGSLWALATLLAVLASARLLRRGRLSFIEFSWEKVAYRRRFSRSSPPAQGFAPTAPLHTPGGCLPLLANAGAVKNGPMRDFGRVGGGLIGVLLCCSGCFILHWIPQKGYYRGYRCFLSAICSCEGEFIPLPHLCVLCVNSVPRESRIVMNSAEGLRAAGYTKLELPCYYRCSMMDVE